MKLISLFRGKKGIIALNAVLLAVMVAVAYLFAYVAESNEKLNEMKRKTEQLAETVLLMEKSCSEIIDEIELVKKDIDETLEKTGAMPGIHVSSGSEVSEIKSELENIEMLLSELNGHVEALKSPDRMIMPLSAGISATDGVPAVMNDDMPVAADEDVTSADNTDIQDDSAVNGFPDKNSEVVRAGQDFTVTIRADEVSNLYGYQFRLGYDKKKAAYTGKLNSEIDGINTIFSKDMDDYLLVGATMIGNTPGYSGKNETVCTVMFTAIEDIDISDFTLSNVNTVDDGQNYTENVSGWSMEIKNR